MWVCCSSAPRGGAEPFISLPPRRLVAVRWVPPTRWAPRRRLRSRSTTCSSEEAGAGGVGACSVREGDAQRARGSARGRGRERASAEGLPSLASSPPPQPPSQTPPSSPCGFAWRPRVGRSASRRLGVCGVGDQSFRQAARRWRALGKPPNKSTGNGGRWRKPVLQETAGPRLGEAKAGVQWRQE